MVEIYNYGIETHDQFARNQKEIDAFLKQFGVTPSGAATIAAQTKILDFVPKHPAIVLLMQTYQRKIWARFMIPKNYYLQRFASSYVAPSLGATEKQDADIHRVEAYLNQKTKGRYLYRKKRREEKRDGNREGQQEFQGEEVDLIEEGEKLITLLEKGVKDTNTMVDYVIARMHQFVQA